MSMKIALLSLALAASASAAHAGSCTAIPVRFTLHQTATLMNLDGSTNGGTVPSAIVGDGNDVYTSNASIKYCSGNYDAVLNLLVGSRKVGPLKVPASSHHTQGGCTIRFAQR